MKFLLHRKKIFNWDNLLLYQVEWFLNNLCHRQSFVVCTPVDGMAKLVPDCNVSCLGGVELAETLLLHRVM